LVFVLLNPCITTLRLWETLLYRTHINWKKKVKFKTIKCTMLSNEFLLKKSYTWWKYMWKRRKSFVVYGVNCSSLLSFRTKHSPLEWDSVRCDRLTVNIYANNILYFSTTYRTFSTVPLQLVGTLETCTHVSTPVAKLVITWVQLFYENGNK